MADPRAKRLKAGSRRTRRSGVRRCDVSSRVTFVTAFVASSVSTPRATVPPLSAAVAAEFCSKRAQTRTSNKMHTTPCRGTTLPHLDQARERRKWRMHNDDELDEGLGMWAGGGISAGRRANLHKHNRRQRGSSGPDNVDESLAGDL